MIRPHTVYAEMDWSLANEGTCTEEGSSGLGVALQAFDFLALPASAGQLDPFKTKL